MKTLLIGEPCTLQSLQNVVFDALCNHSDIEGWIVLTTMGKRQTYWESVLKHGGDQPTVVSASVTSVSSETVKKHIQLRQMRQMRRMPEMQMIRKSRKIRKREDRENNSAPAPAPLPTGQPDITELPVIILNYQTFGVFHALRKKDHTHLKNTLLIIDHAEHLLTFSRAEYLSLKELGHIRMFTTGLRVDDVLSMTRMAATLQNKTEHTLTLTHVKTLQEARRKHLNQTFVNSNLADFLPGRSFMSTILYFMLAVSLYYKVRQWIPTHFSTRKHYGGERTDQHVRDRADITRRRRPTWSTHQTSRARRCTPLYRHITHRKRVSCTHCRTAQRRRQRYRKPCRTRGGMLKMVTGLGALMGAGSSLTYLPSLLMIFWAVYKTKTIDCSVANVIKTLLTFVMNLFPQIMQGVTQFIEQDDTKLMITGAQRILKNLLSTVSTLTIQTDSYQMFSQGASKAFQSIQRVLGVDSGTATCVLGTLGMFVLLWLISVWMKGKSSHAYKSVFASNKGLLPIVKQYWRITLDDTFPPHGYDTIRTVRMYIEPMDTINETAHTCTYLAAQHPFGKGYWAHLKELKSLCHISSDTKRNVYVNACIDHIQKRRRSVNCTTLVIVPDQSEIHSSLWKELKRDTVITQRPGGLYYATMKTLLDAYNKHKPRWHSATVHEIHFVHPPSINDYECIMNLFTTVWESDRKGYTLLGVNVRIDSEMFADTAKVFQYVRRYSFFGTTRAHTAHQFGSLWRHFRTIQSPDELLASRYHDALREWNTFNSHIIPFTTITSTATTLSTTIEHIHKAHTTRVETMQKSLLSSSLREDDHHYMLGYWRAKMQEVELQIREKKLEEEWAKHQKLDDSALEKQVFKNMSDAFRKTLHGVKHTTAKKRSSSRRYASV